MTRLMPVRSSLANPRQMVSVADLLASSASLALPSTLGLADHDLDHCALSTSSVQ
jgi:hypothetical protein